MAGTVPIYVGPVQSSGHALVRVVHYLSGGLTLCGFGAGSVPGEWPPGHAWTRIDGPGATCVSCVALLGEARP
jgi:hypothetical protein